MTSTAIGVHHVDLARVRDVRDVDERDPASVRRPRSFPGTSTGSEPTAMAAIAIHGEDIAPETDRLRKSDLPTVRRPSWGEPRATAASCDLPDIRSVRCHGVQSRVLGDKDDSAVLP